MSPSALKPFGIKLVCTVWNISRSTIHRHKVLALHEATPKKKRGPKTCLADAQVLEEIKIMLRNSPFVGEALAGSWRENNLLAPTRRRSSPGPRVHDGTIVTERPDEMWAIDGTSCMTDQGNATVFVVIDHCTGECLGARAAKCGTRMEAIDTLRQAIRRHSIESVLCQKSRRKRMRRTIHSNTQGANALAHTIRNRRRTARRVAGIRRSFQQPLDPRASWLQDGRAAPTQFPRGEGRDLFKHLCQQWDPVH